MRMWLVCNEDGCDECIKGERLGIFQDEAGWAVAIKTNSQWVPKAPEDHFPDKMKARRCAEKTLEDLRQRGLV